MKINRNSVGLILFTLIMSYGGIEFYYSTKEKKQMDEFLNREYPILLSQDSVNSIITSTFYPKGWRAGQIIHCIKLDDGRGFTVRTRYNLSDENVYFGDIVKQGFILRKNPESDTIMVVGNNRVYKYIIFGEVSYD